MWRQKDPTKGAGRRDPMWIIYKIIKKKMIHRIKLSLEPYFTQAVSYTHLDVYKRQLQFSVAII